MQFILFFFSVVSDESFYLIGVVEMSLFEIAVINTFTIIEDFEVDTLYKWQVISS